MNSLSTRLAVLALASSLVASASAASVLFDVNFEANSVGDNYTVVNGSGVNSGLLGAAPGNITGASNSGSWSAIVDANKDLNLSATADAGGGGIEIFTPQAAPLSSETWFVQFDYTRLETTSGILAVRFLNAGGDNMLGHPNNATLFAENFTGSSPVMDIGSTYTLRMEIDSGTSTVRTYIDGVQFANGLTATNASSFGGIQIIFITGTATDFVFDNFSGGVVPEPASVALLVLGGAIALGLRKRR